MKKLDEIFDIWYGVNLEVVNCEVVENGMPFVSRQSVNNGIVCHVKPLDIAPNPANTLSIAASGSVLTTFYHDYEYYSGRDVYIAQSKQPLSVQEMLFYCYVIEQNKYRYNYGRAANRTLRDILVPAPEEILLQEKNEKVTIPFDEKPLSNKRLQLNTGNWKWFNYSDLFTIKGSQTTPKIELESYGNGDYPYVTTQAVNNGIENYYNFFTEKGNVITVDSAVLGFCAYQANNFSASDHVEKLIPKFECNIYLAMFLTTIINKEQYRYNYGRKCSQIKLKSSKIKLPATPSGAPDWQFMEDYIKRLPYSRCL